MSQLLDDTAFDVSSYVAGPFRRKRWTLAECRELVTGGILDGAKYELIEGDIVPKMGQGRYHIIVVTRLLTLLGAIFGFDFVQTQAPIGIGDSQETSDPEPDLAVLRENVRAYAERSLAPSQDIRLAVEAADTTLCGDLTVKARLYAQSGVPEYWVVDIRGRRLIVFRGPDGDNYRERFIYGETETVAPLSAPQAALLVADMLP